MFWIKAILFVCVFIFTSGRISPQKVSLGGGLNVYFPGENVSAGGGFNLLCEYHAFENFGFRVSSTFNLAYLRGNDYLATDSYNLSSFEAAFIYYPLTGSDLPYVGIGPGYYIPNSGRSGNPHSVSYINEYAAGTHIDNTFGLNAFGGIKVSALSSVSCSLELRYTYFKPSWTAYVMTPHANIARNMEKVNLGSLIFNFAVLVNL